MTVNNLKTGDKAIQVIQHYEGKFNNAYFDQVGVATIGFGHTKDVYIGQIATDDQILQFLKEDLEDTEHWVNLYVTVPLNQDQFDALISFTFNLGSGNLHSSTLLKLLNQGHYDEVHKQMLRWNLAGGEPAKGLTYRRLTEAELFDTGQVIFGNV